VPTRKRAIVHETIFDLVDSDLMNHRCRLVVSIARALENFLGGI